MELMCLSKWIRHLIGIFREEKKANQNFKLRAASTTKTKKYIGKKAEHPVQHELFAYIIIHANQLRPIRKIRLQKKNTSIFTKMESRLYKVISRRGQISSHPRCPSRKHMTQTLRIDSILYKLLNLQRKIQTNFIRKNQNSEKAKISLPG